MRIRKGVVALLGAALLAGVGGVSSYVDFGRSSGGSEIACSVNNDDGIGGGGNRCGKRRAGHRKGNRKARNAGVHVKKPRTGGLRAV